MKSLFEVKYADLTDLLFVGLKPLVPGIVKGKGKTPVVKGNTFLKIFSECKAGCQYIYAEGLLDQLPDRFKELANMLLCDDMIKVTFAMDNKPVEDNRLSDNDVAFLDKALLELMTVYDWCKNIKCVEVSLGMHNLVKQIFGKVADIEVLLKNFKNRLYVDAK